MSHRLHSSKEMQGSSSPASQAVESPIPLEPDGPRNPSSPQMIPARQTCAPGRRPG
jgi:hypothetical protein